MIKKIKKKLSHFSANTVTNILECPMKWYNKKILKLEEQISYMEYIIYGTSIHATLEKNYRQKIESRKDLEIKELQDFFVEHFQEECDKEKRKPNQVNVDKLKIEGKKAIEEYMKNVAPYNQPIAVEKEFLIKSEQYGIYIKGFIDLITEDGRVIDFKTSGKIGGYLSLENSKGKHFHIDDTKKETDFINFFDENGFEKELVDYKGKFLNKKGELSEKPKNAIGYFSEEGVFTSFCNTNITSDRSYTQSYVDEMLQLTMYAIAYRKLYGKVESGLEIEVIKRLKGGAKVQTIKTTRNNHQLKILSELMVNLKKMLEAGIIYPNLLKCSSCGFKNNCTKIADIETQEVKVEKKVEEKVDDVIEIDLDGLDFNI